MKRLLASLVIWAACGGKTGTIKLTVVVSPVDDPFLDAAKATLTVAALNGPTVAATVTNGHFDLRLDEKAMNLNAPIWLDAFDTKGEFIATGATPAFAQRPADGSLAIWVGRPGKIAPAASSLLAASLDQSVAAVPGVGAVLLGGRDAMGSPTTAASMYNVFTQSMYDLNGAQASQKLPLPNARAGASSVATGTARLLIAGGASGIGFASPLSTVSLLDLSSGGSWTQVGGDTVSARSFADLTVLSSGAALFSGGADENGQPLGSAALISTSGTVAVHALASAMVTPRLHHAVCRATFLDGTAGAILFGGNATMAAASERLSGQTFSAYDLGVPTRAGAKCFTMPNNYLVFVGGRTDSEAALASGFWVDPQQTTPLVTLLPNALSTPRDGHSLTPLENGALVCGGADASGKLLASCEIVGLNGSSGELIAMTTARKNHAASLLETGTVLISGGVDQDGMPLSSVEVYTMTPPQNHTIGGP